MNCETLEKLFKRYKGQPVEILTTDEVRYCGIVLESGDDYVEIIDKCNRIIYIPFDHITAVVEPKMKLNRFCEEDDCDCDEVEDECDDCKCKKHHRNNDEDQSKPNCLKYITFSLNSKEITKY